MPPVPGRPAPRRATLSGPSGGDGDGRSPGRSRSELPGSAPGRPSGRADAGGDEHRAGGADAAPPGPDTAATETVRRQDRAHDRTDRSRTGRSRIVVTLRLRL